MRLNEALKFNQPVKCSGYIKIGPTTHAPGWMDPNWLRSVLSEAYYADAHQRWDWEVMYNIPRHIREAFHLD